jgi:hypothetical protein
MKLVRSAIATLLTLAVVTPASAATIPLGGSTTVALDPDTVAVLTTDLGLSVAPIAPGTLDGLNASFPITAAEVEGDDITKIFHSGGLLLSGGGTEVGLSNFTINLPLLTLFGQVSVDGIGDDELGLFHIGDGLLLSLTDGAAAALNGIFGLDALQGGIPIGVASVNPQAVPEPTSMVLLGVGLIMGAAGMRRRARN